MPTKSASKIITREPGWLGPAIHPGEMLLEEFLKPMGLAQTGAARRLGLPLNRLNEAELCPGPGPLAAINAGLR